MVDDLVIATYVLAGVTVALVIVTALYAYYTRQQVKLLKIGHELMKKDIAMKAIQAWATNPQGYANEQMLAEKMKELGLSE